jgi:hypothetical protein
VIDNMIDAHVSHADAAALIAGLGLDLDGDSKGRPVGSTRCIPCGAHES